MLLKTGNWDWKWTKQALSFLGFRSPLFRRGCVYLTIPCWIVHFIIRYIILNTRNSIYNRWYYLLRVRMFLSLTISKAHHVVIERRGESNFRESCSNLFLKLWIPFLNVALLDHILWAKYLFLLYLSFDNHLEKRKKKKRDISRWGALFSYTNEIYKINYESMKHIIIYIYTQ